MRSVKIAPHTRSVGVLCRQCMCDRYVFAICMKSVWSMSNSWAAVAATAAANEIIAFSWRIPLFFILSLFETRIRLRPTDDECRFWRRRVNISFELGRGGGGWAWLFESTEWLFVAMTTKQPFNDNNSRPIVVQRRQPTQIIYLWKSEFFSVLRLTIMNDEHELHTRLSIPPRTNKRNWLFGQAKGKGRKREREKPQNRYDDKREKKIIIFRIAGAFNHSNPCQESRLFIIGSSFIVGNNRIEFWFNFLFIPMDGGSEYLTWLCQCDNRFQRWKCEKNW